MSLLCAQRIPPTAPSPGTAGGQQRAAFLTSSLWPTLTTIRIYFFPLPPDIDQVKWEKPVITGYGADPANPYAGIETYVDPLYPEVQGKVDPITLVKRIVKERLEPLLGLTFEFVDTLEQSDIRIVFGPQYGCSSLLGNTRGITGSMRNEATMEFGWLDIATVIHEFCHALGMIHEHQNPQGNPIQWNKDAVYCYFRRTQGWDRATINNNVMNPYTVDQTNGSNYDPTSIMIYSFPKTIQCTYCDPGGTSTALCPAKTMPTTLNDMEIRPIYRLSPTDIRWLQIMYPKDGKRDTTLIRNLPKDVEMGPIAPTGVSNPYLPGKLHVPNVDNFLAKAGQLFQKHRKVILMAGGALLVFILILSFVSSSSASVPAGPLR